jgi:hypothetical protein
LLERGVSGIVGRSLRPPEGLQLFGRIVKLVCRLNPLAGDLSGFRIAIRLGGGERRIQQRSYRAVGASIGVQLDAVVGCVKLRPAASLRSLVSDWLSISSIWLLIFAVVGPASTDSLKFSTMPL